MEPGAGPPPGTYDRGDVVIGRDATWTCTRAGTSRPYTGAVADSLEGDWVEDGDGTRHRLTAVGAGGSLTFDPPVRPGAGLFASPPKWRRN